MAHSSSYSRSYQVRLPRRQEGTDDMEKLRHWTSRSDDAFAHAISSDFVAQIETVMEDEGMDRKKLAMLAHVSPGRVSQVLNNPTSQNLRSVVKFARAVKRKVAIVIYNDGDPNNEQGPVDAGVFSASWEKLGCPKDLFQVHGVDGWQHMEQQIVNQPPYIPDENPQRPAPSIEEL